MICGQFLTLRCIPCCSLTSPCHKSFMAVHTKDALRCSSIAKVLDLLLTISTLEAISAESLVTGQDGQIFNLIATVTAAVCAVVAYERAIAKQEEVGIRIEECSAGIASEAVNVPSVASFWTSVRALIRMGSGLLPSSKALPSSSICFSSNCQHL